MTDLLGYEGMRCVVTGAASGMGAATARLLHELGAEVTGLDVRPVEGDHVVDSITCDLSDPEDVAAAAARVDEVDSLFSCAGLPTTAPGQQVVAVNFLGHRALTEALLPRISVGGSVGFISSAAAVGWETRFAGLRGLLETADMAAGRAWCEAHDDVVSANGYGFSKDAICAYVAWRGFQVADRVRINAVLPGPTDTPMMPSFVETMGEDFFERFPKPVGRSSTPEEQAWALVMLNSRRSSYVAATNVFTDGGFSGGLLTDRIDFAALLE